MTNEATCPNCKLLTKELTYYRRKWVNLTLQNVIDHMNESEAACYHLAPRVKELLDLIEQKKAEALSER